MTFLEQIQEDAYGRLLADAYFADVPVILQRRGMTEQEVKNLLSVRNARAGKSGACVIVLMPVLQVPDPNVPGPRTSIQQSFLFLEHPTLNASSTGTGKSAEKLAVAGLQLFHHFIPFGVTQVFVASGDAVVPNFDIEGLVGYDLTVSTFVALSKPAKVATPAIASVPAVGPATGWDITLTCATGGASILYSIDGSYPTLAYAAPFNVPTAATLRAAASKTTFQQSDIAQIGLS